MTVRWRRGSSSSEHLDPHELAAERLRSGLGPYEPLPEKLRRFDLKRLLLYALLGVLLIAVFRDGFGRGAPPVHGGCDKPAYAVDRNEVRVDGVVKWSAAGPSGARVVFTADAATPDRGRLVGPRSLKGCKASGRFGVPLTDGEHVLRVFLLLPDGTTKLVGQQKLTVNAPR